ncbi:hypothetical protein GA0115240_157411 [Streptomyces sp. DvalAA-14]|uniref:DUF6886 family protein n=1 Tax=unclassified Streptomyces TaxID=2593676 RepID=UPI00081BA32C|nr:MULTISPECIES: DUF6886 family protein [unclassified Streptomyces]MYS23916.1 hypothetical protein [Streptomyces sp. SID4948]SCE40368.1 hypothetical protein GA0115240_157411 [Streptomyces sp. DvalAA-14]
MRVEPLGPAEPVGDLLRLHREAGIQLRLLDTLPDFWDAVITSTLGFSGIRLRNAIRPGGGPRIAAGEPTRWPPRPAGAPG